MKKYRIVIVVIVMSIFTGCNNNPYESDTNTPKQLNISILLDLSDRISPTIHPATPSHKDRDLTIINNIVEYFKHDMGERGTFDANGRIQVFMEPAPTIPNIDQLQRQLSVDCSKMDVKQKKEVYDELSEIFSCALNEIYTQTIENSKFPGSDIWRFFQNKVNDYCISKDTNYRNILIILTDGYIYDEMTTQKIGTRVQNLTVSTIGKYRNSPDPVSAIQSDDFGLLVPQNVNVTGLEVLVLEVAPENNSQKDEQILTFCIEKWLKEMGIEHQAVYTSDLPANTLHRVERFLDD